jgi:hypothetical protein
VTSVHAPNEAPIDEPARAESRAGDEAAANAAAANAAAANAAAANAAAVAVECSEVGTRGPVILDYHSQMLNDGVRNRLYDEALRKAVAARRKTNVAARAAAGNSAMPAPVRVLDIGSGSGILVLVCVFSLLLMLLLLLMAVVIYSKSG